MSLHPADKISIKPLSASLKARWVKALRSGKYMQGQNALRNGDEFCCLGVLCEISKPVRDKVNNKGYLQASPDEDSAYIVIPEQLQDKLSMMNDSGKSFKKIASYIERSKKI